MSASFCSYQTTLETKSTLWNFVPTSSQHKKRTNTEAQQQDREQQRHHIQQINHTSEAHFSDRLSRFGLVNTRKKTGIAQRLVQELVLAVLNPEGSYKVFTTSSVTGCWRSYIRAAICSSRPLPTSHKGCLSGISLPPADRTYREHTVPCLQTAAPHFPRWRRTASLRKHTLSL